MPVLWESRKEGQSLLPPQYSRSTYTWYCPQANIVSARKTLGGPEPIHFVLHTPGCIDLIWSRVNLKEKLQLTWQKNPPITQENHVLVGISTDGTKCWQRSFGNFAVGDSGSLLSSSSWVLLQGLETTHILRNLAYQENLKLDVLVANEMQVLNAGVFTPPVVCLIIADTKAHSFLSRCRNWKCKDPLAHVYWLCGGNLLHCLGAFGRECQFCSRFGKGG